MAMLIPDCYKDFIEILLNAGFSTSGGNSEGVYSAIPYGWGEHPEIPSRIRWHTGDPDTDPWQWRIRVLNERDDIAYAKLFYRKGGYITREWYPYFLAARRDGMDFDDEYADGALSYSAKRIYEAIKECGAAPVENIKRLAKFERREKSKFESALIELQMRLYITICGEFQKISRDGSEYGWSSMMYCTTESFWGGDVFDRAAAMSADGAYEALREQVYKLNPDADAARIDRYIYG